MTTPATVEATFAAADDDGARRLYVYYRVPAADLATVLQVVAAMQQRLCATHPGLQAELLCKHDGGAAQEAACDEPTLMEVYARRDDGAARERGIDAALQAAIASAAQQALGVFISGRRHVEAFVAFRRGARCAS